MDNIVHVSSSSVSESLLSAESMLTDTQINQTYSLAKQFSAKKQMRRLWIQSLLNSDIERIWSELYRIVSVNPLVRSVKQLGLFSTDSNENYFSDLTQELFVRLYSKGRFDHYIETGMSDAEIECEISQLELKNLLTTELRKRFPESYRIARRIASILHGSSRFRRFDLKPSNGKPRRVAEQIYGLSEWADEILNEEPSDIEQQIKFVPAKVRDTRLVGRTGDVQIVINNMDLEELMVLILQTINQPVSIRTLRSLVMSRLPVLDINLISLTEEGDENTNSFEPVDESEDAEKALMRREAEREAVSQADYFLARIKAMTNYKPKQTARALGTLWHCYLQRPLKTQFEAAAILGVSGSLVSNYCCRIEKELKTLHFSDVETARLFEHILRERLRVDWDTNKVVAFECKHGEGIMPLEFPRVEFEWAAA